MKRACLVAAFVGLVSAPLLAGDSGTLSGEYVEARTAEVFPGCCVMNSEAETRGRQAVLAWKIDHGRYNGVALDGLAVVAAVAGDANLGMREMGGAVPTKIRSAIVVDDRATALQRDALIAMVLELSNGLVANVVSVDRAPVVFMGDRDRVQVATTSVALTVNKHLTHDPACGAMQWFHPFATVDDAEMGLAESHVFTGSALGTKWSDPNKRSAFFARFSR